jgi:hypothetical protein
MKLLTTLRYCLVHIAHDWLRTLLTIISVATIICVYLLSGGLIKYFRDLGKSILTFPNSLLLVMSTNAVFPPDSHITLADLDFYEHTIEDQFDSGTVTGLIPMIYRMVYLEGDAIMVTGVAYQDLIEIARLELVEGSWPDSPIEVLVNPEFSAITNKKIGDSFPVYGTDMTITGMVVSPLWRNAMVVLDYRQAAELYGLEDFFQIGVIELTTGIDPIAVHRAVGSIQENANCCNIYLHDHYRELMQNAFIGAAALSGVIQATTLLLITFGAFNGAAMAMAEHRREIILLRVNGFSNKRVQMFLFLRTLIIMLIAFLLGCIIAGAISYIKTKMEIYSLSGVRILMQFDWKDVLTSLVLTVVLTALGAYISSRDKDPLKLGHNLKSSFQGKVG